MSFMSLSCVLKIKMGVLHVLLHVPLFDTASSFVPYIGPENKNVCLACPPSGFITRLKAYIQREQLCK